MKPNLQPGIHPDADRLSVFAEGGTTVREHERMLAHLAECAQCRKAVFLMQPHEGPQRATATPVKGWVLRWLVPVGLPAAALACALIVVLIYIRPHGSTPGTPKQIASVKQPEVERPVTAVAPTTKSERWPITNSKQVEQSGSPKSRFPPNTTAANPSRQKSPIVNGLNLPAKNGRAAANAAPQTTVAAPSASVTTTGAAPGQSAISSATTADVALNGRNLTQLTTLSPSADTKGAASQASLAQKKELTGLQNQTRQDEALAGVSGRITDRSGAIIAGATVTLRDGAGKARQTTTGADGSFHVTELPAGQYELTATANGFKTSKQSIELKPSEHAVLKPMLDVGAVSEALEVNAGSGAQTVEAETATVSSTITEKEVNNPALNGRNFSPLPSALPVMATASHGKRFLFLDDAGNLFLSRNEGKKWKKIRPQWEGKAVRIELTQASISEAEPTAKNETGAASEAAVFQLTTESGAVWTSKDGAHWRQR